MVFCLPSLFRDNAIHNFDRNHLCIDYRRRTTKWGKFMMSCTNLTSHVYKKVIISYILIVSGNYFF